MLSSARIQQRLAQRSIALVLAGGRGSRLKQLTDRRAKPAVFFGGKFRIIDFALSNCLNSGVRRIGVLSQYKAHSLLRHLQMGWSFLRPEMNGKITERNGHDAFPDECEVGTVNLAGGGAVCKRNQRPIPKSGTGRRS